ncbi:MAG TPA: acyl-CoA dehydrogenase family protein [Stellaceae bacterium]|nr:acyl-CoA dehydrogenase family protein [Stellaceae bacterium]
MNQAAAISREDWLERAVALAPAIAAAADEIERERRIPAALLERMLEAQLFRLLLPRPFGGGEVDPLTFVAVIEEIAKHDASTAWVLCQTAVCAMSGAYMPAATVAEIFGDERTIAAWGAGFGGKAVPVEGGYRLNGKWLFASGGRHATWFGGHSLICDDSGTPQRTDKGAPLTRTLFFPADAVTMSDVWHVTGLRGTGSDAYEVSDLFVSAARSFRRDDPADRQYHAPLYHLKTDTMFSAGFASLALGLARAMLDALRGLALEKTPRGYANPLRNSPAFQSEFGELEAQLRAARAYLMGTLAGVWESVRETGALGLEQRFSMRLAATHTIGEARAVANAAYHHAGATAIFASNPFERRLRDMNAVAQQIQARRSHFETVGKHLLGLEADMSSL